MRRRGDAELVRSRVRPHQRSIGSAMECAMISLTRGAGAERQAFRISAPPHESVFLSRRHASAALPKRSNRAFARRDFHDRVDLDRGTQRQHGDAHGAAGVAADIAE